MNKVFFPKDAPLKLEICYNGVSFFVTHATYRDGWTCILVYAVDTNGLAQGFKFALSGINSYQFSYNGNTLNFVKSIQEQLKPLVQLSKKALNEALIRVCSLNRTHIDSPLYKEWIEALNSVGVEIK